MNHRTGRLLALDLNPAFDEPAPKFFTGPIEIESDFGQCQPGATFNDPAIGQGRPRASAWSVVDAFCASVLVGSIAMLFCEPVRSYALVLLERLVLR